MSQEDTSLDTVLSEIGDFGKYQAIMFSLICLSVVLHSGVHVAFAFTARDLDYRCLIPECEEANEQYKSSWITAAIPIKSDDSGSYKKCSRFVFKNSSTTPPLNCTENNFAPVEVSCTSFVYSSREKTILQEFGLQCEDNLWKLTLVGTINNIGQFFGLFSSGLISDRFGRRIVLVWGLVLCGLCGVIQTFVPSYTWFLVFEFLNACFGAGAYICGFILGVELVGPKKRVLLGTIISSCYPLGEILAAGSAWIFQSWKMTIYILYIPAMFLFCYLWIIPESVRWNLSKSRIDEAKMTLQKAAKFNGKTISENSLHQLGVTNEKRNLLETNQSFGDLIKSIPLLFRLINCCFCWITCAFLFYGLQLNSVSLAGNPFLDFILSALVEIPAYFLCTFILEKGRRLSMTGSFFVTGVACLTFIFIPKDNHMASLPVFLLGKFGATAAFTITYVITSEIFPTPLRHSTMGFCSTFGRIGSMIAPQVPLLAQLWPPLPMMMFTSMSIVAGLLTLLFPETLNTKLPDTIKEALNIGKNQVKDDLPICQKY